VLRALPVPAEASAAAAVSVRPLVPQAVKVVVVAAVVAVEEVVPLLVSYPSVLVGQTVPVGLCARWELLRPSIAWQRLPLLPVSPC